jgi:hypothetical protein
MTDKPKFTQHEQDFFKLVVARPGAKLSGHCFAPGVEDEPFALWSNLEEAGLIKCVGSYRWEPAVDVLALGIQAAIAADKSERHQGQPVACASILVKLVSGKLVATVERFDGSRLPFGCLVDLYKYPPATSDPGEVERVRAELAGTAAESERRRNCCADLIAERDTLRAQLDELHRVLENLKNAHAFKAKCAEQPDDAVDTGAMRDAYEWCRTSGDELFAVLIANEAKKGDTPC